MSTTLEKQRILDNLVAIAGQLELLEDDSKLHLKGYVDGAIHVAYQAACHAVDVCSMAAPSINKTKG